MPQPPKSHISACPNRLWGNQVTAAMEEVVSAEEVVQAMLEPMVAPLLLGCNPTEAPTPDQQISMAKQVHAVVLLYNYYYRKQHRDHNTEFLNFTSFCQLAVILQPRLMAYMKFMHRSDYTIVDNIESQLSLTEKSIMCACDISSTLDAAEAEKWPISKVAVFLVDPRRENCMLMKSSTTCAIWSIIEKYLDDVSLGHPSDSKCINKRKRATTVFSTGLQCADGSKLQELALSAATEATGINRSDLMVLESQVVYSIDKEKTAAQLYLVQFTKSVNEDLMVPIRDVIESLRGPLITKIPRGWTVTQAVEYFHLLPYGEVLSNWHTRVLLTNGSQDVSVELESMVQPTIKLSNAGCDNEKIVNGKRKRDMEGVGSAHLAENAVTILASKGYAISQSALTVLRWKREKLSYQLRTLEDEIALCDKTIKTLINGGESDLQSKIEPLVDGCKDMCKKVEKVKDSTDHPVEGPCSLQYSRGKRLSEAILTLQNQCQQLDQLCSSNNWVLPTYRVFPFEGGFLASVIVKGADFELESRSKIGASPREARESAAAHVIPKVAQHVK